jgi:hypothetical protein
LRFLTIYAASANLGYVKLSTSVRKFASEGRLLLLTIITSMRCQSTATAAVIDERLRRSDKLTPAPIATAVI